MKISLLTWLVALSTTFASQIKDSSNVATKHEKSVADGQWQDINSLNQLTKLQGGDLINKKRDVVSNSGGESNCLDPIPNSAANITGTNMRLNCIGGSTSPDYVIYKSILCAFSNLYLDPEQPQHGVKACTISQNTGEKWCGYCFAHDDTYPLPSITVWDKLNNCQQALLCLDTIIHTSMYGYKPNQCINSLANSIYGPIGVHSYISN
ncbi:hypothetical protein AYI68_g1388 [Smittium mucronatum]|uniref:Uncharacterized protein n=1 Tax=Smittium mucronatum TaxID=133383 RepID=A0A1R0H5I9_9FUNG|nr:hypothetical protein AYI68_g1388 [Smittium mucronatum]